MKFLLRLFSLTAAAAEPRPSHTVRGAAGTRAPGAATGRPRRAAFGKKPRKPKEAVGRRPEAGAGARPLRTGATIGGKAYIIDGDTIRVSRIKIRLAGLDAPEVDQVAKHQDGYWFRQGQRVKSALIGKIGGKVVRVAVHGYDRYGRVIGTVMHEGRDINEWLVWKGYAIAAYGEQYRRVELDAQRAQRGMWGHAAQYDPRTWRHEIQDDS